MKVNVLGGGPAGLYLALLVKQAMPGAGVDVYERNRPGDTFGFGVVFSDETLGNFRAADAESYDAIRRGFTYWDEIETRFGGRAIRSGGHGFCGIGRVDLLAILAGRAADLGARLHHRADIADPDRLRDCDVLVAADGVNSHARERWADAFGAAVGHRPNRFVWLGATVPLDAFTFSFRDTAHGLFAVHAYRYREGLATWLVETSEACWRAHGLDRAGEADTLAFVADLFAADIGPHRLLANRSVWRSFPVVRCRRWWHGNVVLIGDAAHTAHFSIGSGTKLAMEDAIHLAAALAERPGDVPAALAAYDAGRRPEVERVQHAAETSMGWFETMDRYRHFAPEPFAFSLMTRSKQITYDNLRARDPAQVADLDRWFAGTVRAAGLAVPEPPPPPAFQPFRLGRLVLRNRIAVSSMAQYSATDGLPDDWHLVHLCSRAVGGAGLVMTEMTCPAPDARITPGCTGLWNDRQAAAWARVVDFVHRHSGAAIGLQLGHAGRKGSTRLGWDGMDRPLDSGNWPLVAASAIPWAAGSQVPRAMDEEDMARVTDEFVHAARLAAAAGFDLLELHMAHGYLLAGFLSPLTNRRTDRYGGSPENRLRFPLALLAAVRAAWPADRPLAVRISAHDWHPDGNTDADAVAIAAALHDAGCDLIDVSAGQTVPDQRPVYGRMFQTPFADRIRNEARVPVMAVGAVTTADQASTIIAAGRADLVALARPHLADPYFTLRSAAGYGVDPDGWPLPYLAGRDQAMALAERAAEEQAELRRLARPVRPGRDAG